MKRVVVLILAWFGLMFGGLLVQQTDLGHAICGPWGCGPPTAALLGVHLFWLAAILPPVYYLSRRIPIPWKTVGLAITIGSLGGLVAIGIWDFSVSREYYEAGFIWQRYWFRVATLSDVPIAQMLVTGLVTLFFGRQFSCCVRPDVKTVPVNTVGVFVDVD